ncbi:MAG: RNA polymerase sigma factor RpoD/SigA [Bacteroidota bacterium]|jgi:RNA polymerase primary sigma factor|nr:RNA polymerase sigma factor RpoD/SigA [Bacteroidota bacterium]GDX47600.1 RNA polymerase sigma factor RpoD [Bacteroidota bacterium]
MRQLKITRQITARDNDSLERYLHDVAQQVMITPDEEVQLARRIKLGDTEALEKMTKANLRFVVSVAKQYQNQGLALSDLINEGNIGLIKAAQRFDESKGFKFISYAVWWIRQSIMQALVEHSRMVRLPLNKIGSYTKINKIMIRFEQNFEREPSKDELAEILNVSVRDVEEMLKGMTRHASMDAPVGEDEKVTMADLTADHNSRNIMDDLYGESLKRDVIEILATMNPRDSAILSCYFGINGEQEMGLDEIGKRFHLTKERVRQIKEKAIRKLRKSGQSQALKAYLGR